MISNNYERIIKEINSANPECRLVAVTKNHSADEVRELIELGQKDFGENKLQELTEKADALKKEMSEGKIIWHFIGHLQSNKAKKAVELCEWIHSVESLKLAKKIDSAAEEFNKKQKILIEVNVAGEENKYGLNPAEVEDFVNELKGMDNLDVKGLMTMAPFVEAEETRPYFKKLKELADKLGLEELSMGMSNDYRVALEEGASFVRIGSLLFE